MVALLIGQRVLVDVLSVMKREGVVMSWTPVFIKETKTDPALAGWMDGWHYKGRESDWGLQTWCLRPLGGQLGMLIPFISLPFCYVCDTWASWFDCLCRLYR
jgi:hypothetical protein